jgi:hypothetical protein
MPGNCSASLRRETARERFSTRFFIQIVFPSEDVGREERRSGCHGADEILATLGVVSADLRVAAVLDNGAQWLWPGSQGKDQDRDPQPLYLLPASVCSAAMENF